MTRVGGARRRRLPAQPRVLLLWGLGTPTVPHGLGHAVYHGSVWQGKAGAVPAGAVGAAVHFQALSKLELWAGTASAQLRSFWFDNLWKEFVKTTPPRSRPPEPPAWFGLARKDRERQSSIVAKACAAHSALWVWAGRRGPQVA